MFARVKFSVQAGLTNEFLNYIADSGYQLYHITPDRFGLSRECDGEDYRFIARAGRKFQCKVRIQKKKGLYFKLAWLEARKGIFAGAVLFLVLNYIFSNMIWVIDIKTDDLPLKNAIAQNMLSRGVYAGAFYSKDDFEKIKRQLIADSDELGYITLNFYKGVLECEVYPRQQKEDYISDLSGDDIVAQMDGIISDLRVYSGYCDLQLGQSVAAGDVLVKGLIIDKHNNIHISDTRAYIEAFSQKDYSVFIPYNKEFYAFTADSSKCVNLMFAGKNFTVKKAQISGWENYSERNAIRYYSFFGFSLPFTVSETTYYKREKMNIDSDLSTALNSGRLQVQKMIDNDERLVKEESKTYSYSTRPDGVTVICTVEGYYSIA